MAKTVNDGLARLQSESRIPARTWRQWCSLLKLDPADAVDVWEEICYPVMLASRRTPDVPFILQLRAARPTLDVFDLKEEVPKVLHFATFLAGLQDERLTAGKIKGALLAYYRLLAAGPDGRLPSPAFLRLLLIDLCSAVLVSKVLPTATITLGGVLKPVVEGKGTLAQVVRLGLRAASSAPYGAVVSDSLGPSATAARQEALSLVTGGARSSAADDDDRDHDEEKDEEDEEDDEYERGDGAPAASDDEDEVEEDQEEEAEETDAEPAEEADEDEEEAGTTDREEDDGEADDDRQDEEDQDRDEEDDEDEDEDDDEPAASRMEVFLLRFKTALHAVYEAEAKAAGPEETEQAEALLEERLKAITLFRPLTATVPSLEEAQAMVRQAETRTRVVKTHRAVLGARPSAPAGTGGGSIGAGGSGGGGGTGGVPPSKPSSAPGHPAPATKGDAPRRSPPSPAIASGSRTEGGSVSLGAGRQVEVAIADMVEPERLSLSDINEKVHQIGRLLAALEPLDQIVWGVFLDPAVAFKDVRGMARLLSTANTPTARAGQGIRQIVSLQSLQDLVRLPDQLVRKDRSFMVEVSTFVNGVNNNRVFEADSRQLSPLKRILDHAVAAFYRLEVLRINQRFWRERPDEYTPEAVTAYCEEALRLVTDQWNPELRRLVRQKADGDTTTMLQTFAAERFIDQLVEAARVYARELKESGQTRSLDELRLAMAAKPLSLPPVESPPVSPGEVPADLLVSLGLGEVLDELSRSVIAQVWLLMQPVHQPANTARRIQGVLREVLTSTLVLTPERKRHYETPHLALPVASLDKVTGNTSLMAYYVRLRDDGRVAYLEDFEDGTYVDVFELKEHKPMYGPSPSEKAEKEEIPEEEGEEAQAGDRPHKRKYLFTVGRTNKLFAATPSDLINGCIRGTGGGPRIWPRVVGGKGAK